MPCPCCSSFPLLLAVCPLRCWVSFCSGVIFLQLKFCSLENLICNSWYVRHNSNRFEQWPLTECKRSSPPTEPNELKVDRRVRSTSLNQLAARPFTLAMSMDGRWATDGHIHQRTGASEARDGQGTKDGHGKSRWTWGTRTDTSTKDRQEDGNNTDRGTKDEQGDKGLTKGQMNEGAASPGLGCVAGHVHGTAGPRAGGWPSLWAPILPAMALQAPLAALRPPIGGSRRTRSLAGAVDGEVPLRRRAGRRLCFMTAHRCNDLG